MKDALNGGADRSDTALFVLALLYAAALTVSMAAMEILGSLLTLWGLWAIWTARGRLQGRFDRLDAAAVALVVSIVASLAFSPLHVIWGRATGFGRSLLGFIPVKFLFGERGLAARIGPLVLCAVVVAGIAGAYATVQHVTGYDALRGRPVEQDEGAAPSRVAHATGFFSSSMTFGGALLVPFFLALATAKTAGGTRTRWIAAVSAAAIAAGLFAAYQRGPWLGVAAGLAAFLFFLRRRTALVVLLAAALLGALALKLDSRLSERLGSIADLNMPSNVERFDLWRVSWRIFLDHPLLGIGFSQEDQVQRAYYCELGISNGFESHAHNNVMDFLGGTGLLGVASYLALTLLLLKAALDTYRRADPGSPARAFGCGLFCGQVAFFFAGLTECNFKDHELTHQILFWGALAAAAAPLPASKEV